jgi:uncharacterized protein (DUF697 family)
MSNILSVISPKKITILFSLFEMFEQEQNFTKLRHIMNTEEKKAKADEIIKNHVGFSLGAALVPFPGADLLAVSGVQLNMLRQLAKLYRVDFLDKLGKNIISAVVGGSAARLGASLIKAIPGVGTIIGDMTMAALSGASTYALGKVVSAHFAKGGTLDDLDFNFAKKQFEVEIEEGKKVANDLNAEPIAVVTENDTDALLDKLRKLATMRDEGLITVEEYQKLKERLIN